MSFRQLLALCCIGGASQAYANCTPDQMRSAFRDTRNEIASRLRPTTTAASSLEVPRAIAPAPVPAKAPPTPRAYFEGLPAGTVVNVEGRRGMLHTVVYQGVDAEGNLILIEGGVTRRIRPDEFPRHWQPRTLSRVPGPAWTARNYNLPAVQHPQFNQVVGRLRSRYNTHVVSGADANRLYRAMGESTSEIGGLFLAHTDPALAAVETELRQMLRLRPGEPLPSIIIIPEGAPMDAFVHEFRHAYQWDRAVRGERDALATAQRLLRGEDAPSQAIARHVLEMDAELTINVRQQAIARNLNDANAWASRVTTREMNLRAALAELAASHPNRAELERIVNELLDYSALAEHRLRRFHPGVMIHRTPADAADMAERLRRQLARAEQASARARGR